MGRSLESLGKSRNMDMSKDPEGIANYADKPKTFEEHMKELKDLLSSLPNDENGTNVDDDEKHEQDVNEARNAVLETFNKSKNKTENDERITS